MTEWEPGIPLYSRPVDETTWSQSDAPVGRSVGWTRQMAQFISLAHNAETCGLCTGTGSTRDACVAKFTD